jgi:DNA-binding NarL/FixJ family response regulator
LKQEPLLTQREKEVMELVKKGLSNKMIAGQLNISAETVKKHLQNIFAKLDAGNKIEALNKWTVEK